MGKKAERRRGEDVRHWRDSQARPPCRGRWPSSGGGPGVKRGIGERGKRRGSWRPSRSPRPPFTARAGESPCHRRSFGGRPRRRRRILTLQWGQKDPERNRNPGAGRRNPRTPIEGDDKTENEVGEVGEPGKISVLRGTKFLMVGQTNRSRLIYRL